MIRDTWEKAFKDDEKLLQKVKGTIKDTRRYLSKKYRDIGMGQAFYRGDHYGEWNSSSLVWQDEDINQDERPRIVSNQVKVYVDKSVTKVIRYKPSVMTTPMSNEIDDISGSKVGEELLHHFFMVQDIDDKQERWVKAAAVGGVGWMKLDFNPNLSTKIEDYEEISPQPGIKLEVEKEVLYKGDLEITIPNPLMVIPDTISNDFRKHRYWIEEELRPLDELKAEYPKAKDLKAGSGPGPIHRETAGKALENMVRCWRLYFRPCSEFPAGGYAYGTEDKVLQKDTPYPLKHGKLPAFPLPFSSDDEFLWGQAMTSPLIPLQVEYNKIRNIRIENQNYAAAIKFLNPLTSGWDGDLMTNEPGEVIDYDLSLIHI